MAVNFCLLPTEIERIKTALKDGDIKATDLINMTSDERHAELAKYVGEGNASAVNSMFEEKLLLKNVKQGLTTWAKKTSGLSEPAKRDVISRINRMDTRLLNPATQEMFFKDLAQQKLGIGITEDEGRQISKLAKVAGNAQEGTMEYGRAVTNFNKYINTLKNQTTNKLTVKNAIPKTVNLSKSINSSMDDSAVFNPGIRVLFNSPTTWAKDALKSFQDIVNTFGGKETMDEINSYVASQPLYRQMQKGGLRVFKPEEYFPSQVPEKVPLLGRAYKASEVAYTGFNYRNRVALFNKLYKGAEDNGVNVNDTDFLKGLSKMINDWTGASNLGRAEAYAAPLNTLLYSPRRLVSHVNTLLSPAVHAEVRANPYLRKQAAIGTLKIIGGLAGIMATADAFKPGSVELDPRSSNFGKIKIGDTTFDPSGGMNSLLTLAARLATHQTKSTKTGQITKLGTKPGQTSATDVVINFFTNKLSPPATMVKELATREDYMGNPVTPGSVVQNAYEPIGFQNAQQLLNDSNHANTLVSLLADGLGLNQNTNPPSQTNWNTSTAKSIEALKSKTTPKEFKQANQQYNNAMSQWFRTNKTELSKESAKQVQSQTIKKEDAVKKGIFQYYGVK